jgi:hypothetical protein
MLSATHLKRYSKRAFLQTEAKLESEVPRSKPLIPMPISTTTEKHKEANKWNRDKKRFKVHTPA